MEVYPMQNKKTNPLVLFVKESWLLVVCSFAFGLLLAGINAAWQPRIEQNKRNDIDNAIAAVIAGADRFEQVWTDQPVTLTNGKKVTVKLFKGSDKKGRTLGWAFTASGPGYADKIELMIAVDAKFEKILAYKVLFSNETAGFGDKIKTPYFQDQFKGIPAGKLELLKLGDAKKLDDKIVAISGATISSNAMVSIFNSYISPMKAVMKEKGLLE